MIIAMKEWRQIYRRISIVINTGIKNEKLCMDGKPHCISLKRCYKMIDLKLKHTGIDFYWLQLQFSIKLWTEHSSEGTKELRRSKHHNIYIESITESFLLHVDYNQKLLQVWVLKAPFKNKNFEGEWWKRPLNRSCHFFGWY